MATMYYKRIDINGDENKLPKTDDIYFVRRKFGNRMDTLCYPAGITNWLTDIDWYLSPVPRSEIIEILKKYLVNNRWNKSHIYKEKIINAGELEQLADEIIGG